MPDGKTMAILALVAMGVYGVHAIRKPFVHATKKTAQVSSQPFRHPVKDMKAIGHFFKTGK